MRKKHIDIKRIKYNAYLILWLSSGIDNMIHNSPISYKKFKKKLKKDKKCDIIK